MRCTRPDVEAKCRRLSCVHPTVCKLLGTDHRPTIDLLRKARGEGVGSARQHEGNPVARSQQLTKEHPPTSMDELTNFPRRSGH